MHLKSAHQRSNNIPPPTMIPHPNLSLFPSALLRLETFPLLYLPVSSPSPHRGVKVASTDERRGHSRPKPGHCPSNQQWLCVAALCLILCCILEESSHVHTHIANSCCFGLLSALKYHNLDEGPKNACTMESPISAKTAFKAYTSLSVTGHVWLTFLFHCNEIN